LIKVVTSYIVTNLPPHTPYTFQVIVAEDKGGFWGIDYNRGPTKTFVIKSRQKQVKADDPIPNDPIKKDWVDLDTNRKGRIGSIKMNESAGQTETESAPGNVIDFNMYEDSDDDQDGNRGSKVVVRPKTGTVDRRSGVVSFLEAFGKSKNTN